MVVKKAVLGAEQVVCHDVEEVEVAVLQRLVEVALKAPLVERFLRLAEFCGVVAKQHASDYAHGVNPNAHAKRSEVLVLCLFGFLERSVEPVVGALLEFRQLHLAVERHEFGGDGIDEFLLLVGARRERNVGVESVVWHDADAEALDRAVGWVGEEAVEGIVGAGHGNIEHDLFDSVVGTVRRLALRAPSGVVVGGAEDDCEVARGDGARAELVCLLCEQEAVVLLGEGKKRRVDLAVHPPWCMEVGRQLRAWPSLGCKRFRQ